MTATTKTLQIGDVVKTSICGRWVRFKVFNIVARPDGRQQVEASWPKRGSVRFNWPQENHERSTQHYQITSRADP